MNVDALAQIDARLTRIEDKLNEISSNLQIKAPPLNNPSDTASAQTTIEQPIRQPQFMALPPFEEQPSTTTRTSPRVTNMQIPPRAPQTTKQKPTVSLEALLAGRGLQFAGLVLVLIATALFYQLADSRGWIGPFGKMMLGLSIGSGLMAFAAKKLTKAFDLMGEALIALGAGILYLTLWASGELFAPLAIRPEACALMIVVTATLVALGVQRKSSRLVILGGFGGYLTPILISVNPYYFGDLAFYLVALSISLVAVSAYFGFKNVSVLALGASWLFMPILLHPVDGAWSFVQANITIIALFVTSAIGAMYAKADSMRMRTSIFGASILLYVAAVAALPTIDKQTIGAEYLAATIALFLGAVTIAKRFPGFPRIFTYAAISLLTLAIGAIFSADNMTGIYVLEALALILGGKNDRYIRGAGSVIFGLAGLVIVQDIVGRSPHQSSTIIFETIVWLGAYITLLIRRIQPFARDAEKPNSDANVAATAIRIFADIVGVLFLRRVCIDLFAGPNWGFYTSNGTEFAISSAFTAYALALFWYGLKKNVKLLRIEALTLFGITICKVFAIDLASLDMAYRIGSFIVLGIVLFIASATYTRMIKTDVSPTEDASTPPI